MNDKKDIKNGNVKTKKLSVKVERNVDEKYDKSHENAESYSARNVEKRNEIPIVVVAEKDVKKSKKPFVEKRDEISVGAEKNVKKSMKPCVGKKDEISVLA